MIARVSDINSDSSKFLRSLPNIITVRIDSKLTSSAEEAVQLLKTKHGIARLDTVIANAGTSNYYSTAIETPLGEVREHFEINTVDVLVLFRATCPSFKSRRTLCLSAFQ
jgi:norsolorinic acid ketoreductase